MASQRFRREKSYRAVSPNGTIGLEDGNVVATDEVSLTNMLGSTTRKILILIGLRGTWQGTSM